MNLDLVLFVAKDEGESVFVEGVKDASLRSQLAAFLTALGLAGPAGPADKPQAFRCSGGGVLRSVAALMDEQELAKAPPLDREAAFLKAKEVSRGERRSTQQNERIGILQYYILPNSRTTF